MPKRDGGNRQLRAHEIDALEGQSENAGIFKTATPDTIKKRRIVKARSRSSTKKPKATGTPLRSNPFAGFNLGGGGAPQLAAPKASFESTVTPQLNSLASMGGGGADDADAKFIRKRSRLNQSFHQWVNKQMDINKFSDWTIGVQDYITHMQKLKEKHRNAPRSAPAPMTSLVPSKPTTPAAAKKDDAGEAGKPAEGTEDEEIKFQTRAKVFEYDKEITNYKVKGVGDLRVLVHRTTQKSRLVMYDACKRLMLNLNLYKGITFKREGKNNVAFIAKGADEDGKEEVKKRLIRVKNSGLADSLKEALTSFC